MVTIDIKVERAEQFKASYSVKQDGKVSNVKGTVPALHLTMRLELDAAMFAHALDAGVEDFTGQAIAELTETAVKLRNGTTLAAAVIIGADGVNSIVAKQLFGKSFDTKTIGFGLEIEAAPELLQDDLTTAWSNLRRAGDNPAGPADIC